MSVSKRAIRDLKEDLDKALETFEGGDELVITSMGSDYHLEHVSWRDIKYAREEVRINNLEDWAIQFSNMFKVRYQKEPTLQDFRLFLIGKMEGIREERNKND